MMKFGPDENGAFIKAKNYAIITPAFGNSLLKEKNERPRFVECLRWFNFRLYTGFDLKRITFYP